MPDQFPVTLAVGGDMSLAQGVSAGIREHSPGWVFEKIAPALAPADLMTFNWESPILPAGQEPPEKGLVVPADLVAGVLTPLPRLAVTLANNHAFDAGQPGLCATLRKLDELDVAHFGSGETEDAARQLRVVEVNGLSVGFLGRTEDCPQIHDKGPPGPARLRYPEIVHAVRSATRHCDCLVVHLHHGVEFVDWPAPHFVRLCRELADAGASVVAAGHPHVPQGHEQRGDSHIFYSLGNLVFDIAEGGYQHQGSPWTRRSAVALLPLGKRRAGRPTLVPYRIDSPGRPAPLDGADAQTVLDHLASLSADLEDRDTLRDHWHDTALRYLGIYIRWATGTLDENGAATPNTLKFLTRLPLDESRMFVRELFDNADWPGRLHKEPWT